MTGVLPWVAVMTAVGATIWWMLDRDMNSGRWLLGAVLLGHGLVHIMYAIPEPQDANNWPFVMDRSWAISSFDANPSLIRTVGLVLIGVTIAGLAVAALSTVGILIPAGWWQALVVVGAAASLLALVLFVDPQLILGIAINAVLIWVAVGGIWVPD